MKNLFDTGSSWSLWAALLVIFAALAVPSLLLAAVAALIR